MHLFIGIDLGTSGCRAIAIDEHNTIHGETAVSLPTPQRDGNRVEQDPELWWEAVCECLHTLTKSIDSSRVASIAVDGTSASFLLTDTSGAPLTPGIMYNDARATKQAEAISRIAPTNTAAQGATCALAKLLWLQEKCLQENTAAVQNAKYISFQADWISAKLSGRLGISDYNNVLKLGFDAEQKQWPDWLKKLKTPMHLLPEVVAPGTVIGNLTKNNAQHFGLPENTCIVAGTTDSTASFIATGASRPGEAVTALGSTLVLKVITDKPVFAPEYGVYSQPLFWGENLWLVGGSSNTGGSVLKQYFTSAQLQAMTPQLRPDQPTGLDYYPLPCAGERFPTNDAQLQPRLNPRPENDVTFFQGMLEGMAKIEASGYRLLEKLGAPYPVSVRSTGGGAKNTAWATIRKNLLCDKKTTTMVTAQNTEAAFGAALLARHGLAKHAMEKPDMQSIKKQENKDL